MINPKETPKDCWLSLLGAKKSKPKKTQWLWFFLVAVFVILAVIAGSSVAFYFSYYHQGEILPNVRVGNLKLSGLTGQEAGSLIASFSADLEKEDIKILYEQDGQDVMKNISPIANADNPDLARSVVDFDADKITQSALAVGREGNFFTDFVSAGFSLFQDHPIPASFDLDESSLKNLLKSQFSDSDQIGKNATPQIIKKNGRWEADIIPEKTGFGLDYDEAVNKIRANLSEFKGAMISLQPKVTKPEITVSEVQQMTEPLIAVMSSPEPVLVYKDKNWTLKSNDLVNILEFQKRDGEIKIGLNQEAYDSWLKNNVAPQVEIEPQNSAFEIKDGKVMTFANERDGQKIDEEATYNLANQNINQALVSTSTKVIIKTVKPEVVASNVNNLGIKEVIGEGRSSFAGSPANRRHNIATGAAKINGMLIKPGEEFSLIKALGDVDGTTGYLTELVIKGNKTTPEYGGGLCQIGTTVFRTALGSGLPITERHNHSYSVTYYLEDGLPGVDATIYIPHPDLRFVNDTGNYILIQTHIEGDNLRFEFWGTRDGRVAERTKPKTWGVVSPPPTKYVETTDIPVGQKKCTESSHKGISASFDYKVTYATGEIKNQTFTSYYKPWQAVCLMGVASITSSTPAVIDVNPLSTTTQN